MVWRTGGQSETAIDFEMMEEARAEHTDWKEDSSFKALFLLKNNQSRQRCWLLLKL